jgi:hypothetical protein
MNRAKEITLIILTIIFVLFTINITELQYRFDFFNLYKNKINYSGNNLRHSINDYLYIIHKQMLEQISKKDEENNLFDENWSGFNIDNIDNN